MRAAAPLRLFFCAQVLGLALLLAGCASVSTATYTLSASAPAQPAAGPALGVPIEVGTVSIPPAIDRTAIVLRAPNDRLVVSATSVWGAPIRQLIRAALSADLAARLPAGSVLPPGAPAPAAGLRILTVIIREFGGDTDGRVVLDAAWTLAPSGVAPEEPLHEARIVLEAGSGSVADVVPVMGKALGALAERIVLKVRRN